MSSRMTRPARKPTREKQFRRRRERGRRNELAEPPAAALAVTTKKEPTDRTDDPVRMYLREMGSVELLSREGEIAIAKRIEAGRETMIAGLCESPLTFQAIIIWRDELNEGKILLREIIDLEATYAGPEAKAGADACRAPGRAGTAQDARRIATEGRAARRARTTTSPMSAAKAVRRGRGRMDDDEFENLSLAAMEAELRPQVMETLDVIADTYKKLRKLQDQQVENRRLHTARCRPARTAATRSLRTAHHRGEVAVAQQRPHRGAGRAALRHQQAPGLRTRAAAAPGRKLRRRREDFLKQYQGSELDPNWIALDRQSLLARLEGIHLAREGHDPRGSARGDPRISPPRPASRSPSSARS
jgi:RNA polymerase primary sigma factor